jgi:hypothetical protein
LATIDLHGDPRVGAQQVDLHPAPPVERDWEIGIQLESTPGLWQGFEATKQERLAGAPSATGTFDFRRSRKSSRHEQIRQRRINAVANESPDAGRVISFPYWIRRQHDIGRPTGYGTRRKDNRVPDSLVAAATSVKHSCQHRHVQIRVVVDPHLPLAVVEAMQPSNVLRNRPPP